MKDIVKKTLRLRKVLIGKDLYIRKQININTITLGNKNACWTISDSNLSRDAIIYSFGVGTDISFDLAIINQYKVIVHAFDPTPKSISWIKEQKTPSEISFHPFGIAAKTGKLDLYLPKNEDYISGSILSDMLATNSKVSVEVKDMTSIMTLLRHDHIDILKMDIEGAEYDVIQDIVEHKINIKQILIEFHHRFPTIGVQKTKGAIRLLNNAGYKIFDVSPSGEEFSFIKP